ncbi:8825_t:CDS:1, partial [Funneliformis caledonium]
MVNNIPTLRYLEITAVSDTSAELLLKVIDSFILQKGLPANKLYYLESDGTSNMI